MEQTETYKNHTIEIKYQNDPESPREWDNICIVHNCHSRYSLGDKNYNNREDIDEAMHEAKKNGDIIVPLYLYDHGGITISLTPFSCPWDSGQVGFVQVPRKKMLEEFGKKNFTPKLKVKALEIAESEIETLDRYVKGEVYGYIIDEDGGCWGYYSIEDAQNEAKAVIDYLEKMKIELENI